MLMALLLYDNPSSGNALKVRFLLRELGLEWETREVPLSKPRPEWYLDVNPLGGVPTLVDGEFVLTESNTILRYLAKRENRADLYAEEPREQAQIDEFLDRWSLTFRPVLKTYEAAVTQGGDEAQLAAVADEIAPTLQALDALVTPGPFALGTFTLVDIAAAPALHRSVGSGIDLARYPAVREWRSAVLTHPAFANGG
jgi:glutathione S-transferase